MPVLDLVSPDKSVCHAIREQMAVTSPWRDSESQLTQFMSLHEALKAWRGRVPQFAVLDDVALDDAGKQPVALDSSATPGLFFVLGNAGGRLDDALITEAFSKPLRLGHLFARMQFHAQTQVQARDKSLTLGVWRFSPRERQLFSFETGKIVRLTDKESSLLEYLSGTNEPLSRDELLAAVWGYDGGLDTHTLETHIYRLRRKLSSAQEPTLEIDPFLVDHGGYRINPLWRDA